MLDPGERGGWNDMNSDGTFDRTDVELFWESFRAKPGLWALVVDPSPALGLADAYDSPFVAQYTERLVALGNTLRDIEVAVDEAITRMTGVIDEWGEAVAQLP